MSNMKNAVTEFQSKCYKFISDIPPGYVMSYGDVALHLNTCARAVGTAMKRNPYAPSVPCHRIIKSDRTLGGFFGSLNETSEKRKRKLVEIEGVTFDSDGRVSKSCMYMPVGMGGSEEPASNDATTGKRKRLTSMSTKARVTSPNDKFTVATDKGQKISSKLKRLRRGDDDDNETLVLPPCSNISREDLADEILKILHSRERGKTC